MLQNGMLSVKFLNENLGWHVAPCWSIVLCEVTFCASIVRINMVVVLSLALDALALQSCIVCAERLAASEKILIMANLTNVDYTVSVIRARLF